MNIQKIKDWLNAEDIQSEMGGNILVLFFRHFLAIMLVLGLLAAVIVLIVKSN